MRFLTHPPLMKHSAAGRLLPHLLTALARQEPRPRELLLIEDRSNDSIAAIAQRIAANPACRGG
jgi:glycosyltransferase involved in cell wall biosynthesis